MTIESYLQRKNLARFPFIFIVTFGRSCSTLLQGMLNAIDGYCVRGENDGALFNIYKAIAGVERLSRVWGGASEPVNPMYGAHLLEPEEFQTVLLDAFFDRVLNVPPESRCCRFKEIRHTMFQMKDAEFHAYMDFLEGAFPGAGFIFNIRSIEGASKSSWWGNMKDDAKKYGILVNARQRLASRASMTKNGLLFSYDEWIADPDYARRLFDFLGEPYDGAKVREVLATRHSIGSKPT
jgi:hypothetical protein